MGPYPCQGVRVLVARHGNALSLGTRFLMADAAILICKRQSNRMLVELVYKVTN